MENCRFLLRTLAVLQRHAVERRPSGVRDTSCINDGGQWIDLKLNIARGQEEDSPWNPREQGEERYVVFSPSHFVQKANSCKLDLTSRVSWVPNNGIMIK